MQFTVVSDKQIEGGGKKCNILTAINNVNLTVKLQF